VGDSSSSSDDAKPRQSYDPVVDFYLRMSHSQIFANDNWLFDRSRSRLLNVPEPCHVQEPLWPVSFVCCCDLFFSYWADCFFPKENVMFHQIFFEAIRRCPPPLITLRKRTPAVSIAPHGGRSFMENIRESHACASVDHTTSPSSTAVYHPR
jgi:hypothetical protein